MTCLESQSNILSFVENSLPEDKKVEFVKHIKHCKNCKEELEIYYTLIVGMRKLDNNEELSLDFKSRLDDELNKIENKARKATRFKISTFGIFFSIVVVLIVFIYNTCLTKVYQIEQDMKKQAQGEAYFYRLFGENMYECSHDLIAESMIVVEKPTLSFYDSVDIYNVVNSFDSYEFYGGIDE